MLTFVSQLTHRQLVKQRLNFGKHFAVATQNEVKQLRDQKKELQEQLERQSRTVVAQQSDLTSEAQQRGMTF